MYAYACKLIDSFVVIIPKFDVKIKCLNNAEIILR